MSELKFIETTDETIYTDILEELENGVGEPLYPGDERRIFGDTMAKVIVTVYNTVNDACRQKMLRYARGTVLDALGENRDVIRLDPTYATTTLRFTVTEAVGSNIIIPAGLRVTGDFVHYLWLMETIINCDHTPFGLPPGKSADEIPPSERLFEVGMPIGNLTSQLLANVCLNELDQYIKHELKAHFYDRYMDDMALLYPDAATLNRWRAAIEKYLNEVLHLELNSKTTIGLVKHGITFVGCRIYPGYRKPTAQSVKKMKARMRYIAKEYEAGLIDFDAVDATMQSYFGLMSHCSTHGLQKWIEKNIIFKRKEMADIELPQEVTQWELNQF